MSITDELREYARHLHNVWYDPRGDLYTYTTMDNAPSLDAVRLDEHVLAIADRIDAAHEEACDDAWDNGYEADYLGIENWLVEHQQVMEHHGWVKLPKDADGKVIRIGDRMENGERVARIVLTDGSWEPSVYTAVTPNQLNEYYCHAIRHHKQSTVEDVLTEFGIDWEHEDNCEDRAALLAEYAKRLKLAGENE